MAAVSLGILAPAQLERHRFFAEPVRYDLRLDRCPFYHGGSDLEGRTVTDEEHLVEHELAAHGDGKLFDPQFFPGGNAVLFASGSDHRVHADLRIALEKDEIIHTFSGYGQRNYAMLTSRRQVDSAVR